MDFSLSDDQEALRESVQRYCQNELANAPDLSRGDVGAAPDRRHWEAFANLGWLGVLVPEEAGGSGGTIIEASIMLEELGRGLVSEPFLPCAVVAAEALARIPAAHPRRNELLRHLVSGERIVVWAHSESGARGDAGAIRSEARHEPSGAYRLSGHKSFVLSGPRADTFLVSARVADLRKDETGLALFVVPRDAAGLACRDFVTMDGRGATELTLDDVRVEQDDRLTLDGEGENVIEACTQYAIAGTCAEAIGAMDDVVKVTASYLKTRRAYGTTLNTFQALQHRMADMLVELEMSRSMLLRLLAAFSREDELTRRRTVSAAKALIGGSAKFIASHGIQLHGAMGMVAEYVIGRHFKQLTMLETLFGNSSFHWERCVGLSFAEPVADNDKTERPVPARSSVQAI